jgi:hypothetical protein
MSADKSQGKIGTLKAESPDTLLNYRRHERLFYPVIAMMVHRVLGKQSLAAEAQLSPSQNGITTGRFKHLESIRKHLVPGFPKGLKMG